MPVSTTCRLLHHAVPEAAPFSSPCARASYFTLRMLTGLALEISVQISTMFITCMGCDRAHA